jgi:3'(2'), 5'-bisphosphate nucleotidase
MSNSIIDFQELVGQVQQIAIEAGAVIMDIYNNADDFNVETKSDNSPLTRADKAANDLIVRRLQALTPSIPIVSEEGKDIPYETRRGFEYNWLVDPLDGTKEFIKRNGEFTVNIALIHQQKAVLGVVYAPVPELLYWAFENGGAFCKDKGQTGRISAAQFQLADAHLKAVCSRSHLTPETEAFLAQLDNPSLVSRGSSFKFLLLAQGLAHVYPRMAPTMEWDTAAAQIVLEEAGGTVLENGTNAPLRYNKEVLRNPHFVAYGKLVQ